MAVITRTKAATPTKFNKAFKILRQVPRSLQQQMVTDIMAIIPAPTPLYQMRAGGTTTIPQILFF
ncbi:hypothetical protein BGZ65_000469 [Modicella reniformis]|uniref:Uncharacterized protein n=1 Tax=Modicella reniformis TaxID=1440133 RepID=A0A9P6M102_9FUNG|nr:hypothetical protein BGZ65_000469 [Modicella reniformis]